MTCASQCWLTLPWARARVDALGGDEAWSEQPGEETEAGGQAQLLCELGGLAEAWDHSGTQCWSIKLAHIKANTFM